MKIPDNSIVDVRGWVMLKKVGSTRYKVRQGGLLGATGKPEGVYWFFKPRGRKPIIGHYASDVDCWVNPANHPNYNKIVLITA